MQNLAQVQNEHLTLPIRQDAHADGAKRPEVEKLIILYDVGFFYQLHIASDLQTLITAHKAIQRGEPAELANMFIVYS